MPSDNSAIKIYRENGLVFGPAKAANAGGVAVSGIRAHVDFCSANA